MSSFTTPLVVSPLPDGRKWRLVFQFRYHIGKRWSKDIIIVPVGFVTDFASVPWLFWTFLPYWGKYGKAAVLHDYLYQEHNYEAVYNDRDITRKQADQIFHEAMLIGGTRPWKARIMYWGVRVFGWLAWR